MCFNQYDKSSFDELIPRIEKADCQGVVIATQFHDSVVKLASRLDQLQIPYILIDAFIENTNCVAYYGTNSYVCYTNKSTRPKISQSSALSAKEKCR